MSKILITLVTDAGRNCSCALWEYNTWPVVCSIKIALPDSNERLLLSFTSELVSLICEELSFVESFNELLLGDHT